LQRALWERFQIEVPIVAWDERRWIRVSCHLYSTREQIDTLARAVDRLVRKEGL
jgi:selenocysteine lyase/cysteine desulfurase